MAFSANARVSVTDQSSVYRNQSGTVEVAAADADNGFNHVRIDGHPVGKTYNFSDAQLRTTNFDSPVEYS